MADTHLDEQGSLISFYTMLSTFQLQDAIVKQVEYYFSDNNLPGDQFLFVKSMRKNSRAFVKVRVLMTFRKLKALTHDVHFVADALRKRSTLLEVSENGQMVRRRWKLPSNLADENQLTQRCIRVDNIPSNQNVEEIERKFEAFGKVRSVRINCEKGEGRKPFALVEFETKEFAINALKTFEDQWRDGLRLSKMKPPTPKKAATTQGNEENQTMNTEAVTPPKSKILQGKIRSIDSASKCGFIVQVTSAKKRRSKSTYFKLETVEGDGDLQVGDRVAYKVRKNKETGEEEAFEVKQTAKAARKKPTSGEKRNSTGFMTMAKGPPEGKDKAGFSATQFRGLRNQAA